MLPWPTAETSSWGTQFPHFTPWASDGWNPRSLGQFPADIDLKFSCMFNRRGYAQATSSKGLLHKVYSVRLNPQMTCTTIFTQHLI